MQRVRDRHDNNESERDKKCNLKCGNTYVIKICYKCEEKLQ